jgi:serine phosphatase RsbU (regulator of sigma subunit)
MANLLETLADRLWPDSESESARVRAVRVGDLFGILYAAPLVVVVIVWLIVATNLSVLRESWLPLLILFALVYALRRLDFTSYTEIERGLHASFGGSADDMVRWPAALMFGPTALWMFVFWRTYSLVDDLRRADSAALTVAAARSYTVDLGGDTLAGLAGLALYSAVGGTHPPAGLSLQALAPAILATLVRFTVPILVSAPHLLMTTGSLRFEFTPEAMPRVRRFMWVAESWPLLLAPFAVFATGLYAEKGLVAFLFIVGGALFASALAHRMSSAVELSTERGRELSSLVYLGWAISEGPPDVSRLPALLKEHVGGMFAMSTVNIRLFPNQTLLNDPNYADPPDEVVWDWMQNVGETLVAPVGQELPWGETPRSYGTLLVPILHTESEEVLGGIAIRKRVDPEDVTSVVPAAESLATLIASALHGAEVYEQTLRTMRVENELSLAADMQSSLMPSTSPEVPGWEFRAIVDSAREVSGDFIDLIPLTAGRWGILVADVSGKGVAAALYMAMVRTLIRTYSYEHEGSPAEVAGAANLRILADTSDEFFTTAFYGVLDPSTGRLVFCNAGHNPPVLLRARDGAVEELGATGIPLGMIADTQWEERGLTLAPGDRLLAYTDGVTEAMNVDEEPFGDRRLVDVATANAANSVIEMRTAIFDEVAKFVGEAERLDDMTVMIVARDRAA